MGVAGKLVELRWRAAGHYRRLLPNGFLAPLTGLRGLEIGGPSAVFGSSGLLPAYDTLGSVDNVQWVAETAWHDSHKEGVYAPEGTPLGTMRVFDDVELLPFADATFDVVLSSHVLEHLANPLSALAAWHRVTGPGGHVLLVMPHKEGTFDHRRPTTTVSHMVEDFEQAVGEDDLTHLGETLRLHDRTRDSEPGGFDEWAERRRQNHATRVLHHHVFTTSSVASLLGRGGLEVLALETRWPHDIYALARFDGEITKPALIEQATRGSPLREDSES